METKESRKKKQSGNSGSNGKEENCEQRKTHKKQDKSTSKAWIHVTEGEDSGGEKDQ